MNTKVCTKCHIEKTIDMFFNDKEKKDGLRPICKQCTKEQQKEHYLKKTQSSRKLYLSQNINNFPDYHVTKDGDIINRVTGKKRLLKIYKKRPYKTVDLYNNDLMKRFQVHRLVALAYIPNPNNKPQVNHKDVDKSNNNVLNLEWVTPKENMEHASMMKVWKPRSLLVRRYGSDNHNSKPIECLTLDGKLIQEFPNARAAIRAGFGTSYSHISNCANGKRNKHNNYKWRFKNEQNTQTVS